MVEKIPVLVGFVRLYKRPAFLSTTTMNHTLHEQLHVNIFYRKWVRQDSLKMFLLNVRGKSNFKHVVIVSLISPCCNMDTGKSKQ